MRIKQKSVFKGQNVSDGGESGLTLKVGQNEFQEVNKTIETPNFVQTITANNNLYSPNTSGNVDLGEIGGANNGELTLQLNGADLGDFSANQSENETININSVTSISQNGQDSQVDNQGNIDLGQVVKQIRFQGSTLNPQSNGLVSLPNPYTTIYGSIFGGLLGVNNSYNDFSSYTNPIGYLNPTTYEEESSFNNWGYLINWRGNYINTILSLQEYNKTGNYTYTAKIRCEYFGGKDNITIYPILYKYFTASDKNGVRICLAVKGISWADKPLNYGFSKTISSANSYLVGMDYSEGENSSYYPTNLITQNGITENGVYIVEIGVTNNVVSTYTITKESQISVTANGVTYNESNNNVDIGNYCQSVIVDGNSYQVNSQGEIDLGNSQVLSNYNFRISDFLNFRDLTPHNNQYWADRATYIKLFLDQNVSRLMWFSNFVDDGFRYNEFRFTNDSTNLTIKLTPNYDLDISNNNVWYCVYEVSGYTEANISFCIIPAISNGTTTLEVYPYLYILADQDLSLKVFNNSEISNLNANSAISINPNFLRQNNILNNPLVITGNFVNSYPLRRVKIELDYSNNVVTQTILV